MNPITRYRLIQGWTQGELARRLEVALSTVQRWEQGTRPHPKTLRELAQVLGVDTAILVDELAAWQKTAEPKKRPPD